MTAGEGGQIDREAVAALFREHAEELRRFLTGVLRDPQLANDALQAAFVKLVERGAETAEETRKAWLFRVAYNEALQVRRRQATGHSVLQKVAWSAELVGRAADELLLRGERIEEVRQALTKLPYEQEQIVRMRIYEEKTFAVIAEELKIP